VDGLGAGRPDRVPVANSDFISAATVARPDAHEDVDELLGMTDSRLADSASRSIRLDEFGE
jgi:hypothetical protein